MSEVNKTVLAEIFGVSTQAVDKWRHEEGFPEHGTKGKPIFITGEVYRWLLDRYKKSNLSELDIEDVRLKRAKANKVELEYQRMAGEMLPVDIIMQTIQSSIISARTKILSVKSEIKIQMPDISSAALEMIDKKIREAMDDLGRTTTPDNVLKILDGYYAGVDSPDIDEGE